MPVNFHNTDYAYMCTNNAIISNNKSKDLIALGRLHVTSKSLTISHCMGKKNIYLCFFTAIIHIPHCTAQMMDSERAGVFTDRCFNLFTSNA